MSGLGTRTLLGSYSSRRKWTTSSAWAVSPPFPRPFPGRYVPGATSGSCSPRLHRDVVEQFTHIEIVGKCAALAEMPECSLGRASTRDGLPVYVLLCPQLYDRPRQSLRRWSRPRLAGQRHPLRPICLRRCRTCHGPFWTRIRRRTGPFSNDWQAALHTSLPRLARRQVPSILTIHNLAYQGLFPKQSLRRIGAPGKLLPYRWTGITTSSLLPQGRHRHRLASDHRRRHLCEEITTAQSLAAAWRSLLRITPTPCN